MSTKSQCVFCTLPRERVCAENDHAVWILDGFPVSAGHSLVIPKRHVASFFDATEAERLGLLSLLDKARDEVTRKHAPDAFNIGINDGVAAGQTVLHLHIHLIPRYRGDRVDPRGGVRWVIPEKADYWTKSES
ncbi:HIT family protein [uncultured Piscinibacter sp.]|uniref:HIT family protein n=1 Tax=uncultured Piscinibacter sp. TaxID=1131835 RepID=UPI00262DA28D|nr:HIT family protein [uncultured Piscinibacter sp.]